ncbi:HAMP domain-containing methyl-accepting chemotaxis protein [Psychrosphaera sp. 1_MG-2023]|uniref:methyl-accepting chemotaxis protein n=1 Tax=Psychrosphaera sp. 1_MG-2023 TaxID=3062643 RepID=UPI0026E48932|nr:HAMP domain-containing methyl-accepting chemotaxis protein [Psychrosphaera sp. 1_MG-2023]MDO6720628.1 HAMP domain-containing methyl-accepting chemotaxis protein [Psychrosphaera sp. 1_MG-2023]
MRSSSMALSPSEQSWLPWFGENGKLSLGLSCYLNNQHYGFIEKTFEGIATTRLELLRDWTENQWHSLQNIADEIRNLTTKEVSDALNAKLKQSSDMSELFVIDQQGTVLSSSYTNQIGVRVAEGRVLKEAFSEPFLHGPYVDQTTLKLGNTSSKFHDAVTLMFYLPLTLNNNQKICLCGRVPNDVLGDLIQREAGHIYQDSGDNYLFMVNSKFDSSIKTGTALSRSRFEDRTFSLGDNLKDGVKTEWGVVRVKHHTELELRFTDPATGQLHPGVRETIKNGQNLFVTYPGYSDYRHIPVIGKGLTFSLPGSRDTWGMMCEGDLEEVYRRRSLSLNLLKLQVSSNIVVAASAPICHELLGMSWLMSGLATLGLIVISGKIFSNLGTSKVAKRLQKMTDVIRGIAEGGGNLKQRLKVSVLPNDETGQLGRWVNSFIDSLDSTVGKVIQVSDEVKEAKTVLIQKQDEFSLNANQVLQEMQQLLDQLEMQLGNIQNATQEVVQIRSGLESAAEQSVNQFKTVQTQTDEIRGSIEQSTSTIQDLNNHANNVGSVVGMISQVADQTNLLALNAAIEAARAGEQGRGFAVVADEVRNLARRTGEATAEISILVTNIQENAKHAVTVMEDGVAGIEQGLLSTEETLTDDQGLGSTVAHMLSTLSDINQKGTEQLESAKQVADITSSLQASLSEVKVSTSSVDVSAVRLERLMSRFQVSEN